MTILVIKFCDGIPILAYHTKIDVIEKIKLRGWASKFPESTSIDKKLNIKNHSKKRVVEVKTLKQRNPLGLA